MAIEFYNVRTKKRVSIDESKVKKTVLGQGRNPRYAVVAEQDGTPLYRFVSKAAYDSLKVAEKK